MATLSILSDSKHAVIIFWNKKDAQVCRCLHYAQETPEVLPQYNHENYEILILSADLVLGAPGTKKGGGGGRGITRSGGRSKNFRRVAVPKISEIFQKL